MQPRLVRLLPQTHATGCIGSTLTMDGLKTTAAQYEQYSTLHRMVKHSCWTTCKALHTCITKVRKLHTLSGTHHTLLKMLYFVGSIHRAQYSRLECVLLLWYRETCWLTLGAEKPLRCHLGALDSFSCNWVECTCTHTYLCTIYRHEQFAMSQNTECQHIHTYIHK